MLGAAGPQKAYATEFKNQLKIWLIMVQDRMDTRAKSLRRLLCNSTLHYEGGVQALQSDVHNSNSVLSTRLHFLKNLQAAKPEPAQQDGPISGRPYLSSTNSIHGNHLSYLICSASDRVCRYVHKILLIIAYQKLQLRVCQKKKKKKGSCGENISRAKRKR